GGRIEGTVQKHNMQKFNRCMIEGQVYKVSKYNLKVEVSDGEDSTYFLLGDDDVQRLLKVPCEELMQAVQHPDDPLYPPIFEQLIGQNMLFLAEVQKRMSTIEEGCFKTMKPITRLVGHGEHTKDYPSPVCSSQAGALPHENFCTANSDVGEPSSSSSVSCKNLPPPVTGDDNHI
ncbi:Nucleic acid-binding, OB-fold, partial [Sesbania bispinosa]